MRNNSGMHPGVIEGKRMFPKKNTCAPRKRSGGILAKKQANLSRRRNDHSATLSKVDAKQKAAFKTPGSMNKSK